MKKLLIILLSALSLTAVAQQKKVAVYVTGQQSGINKVLGDQLVAAFAKSGKYTAVERTSSFLAELSKEQGYQRSGAVNDREIARLGVQFGVNYVCVADMSDVFGEKYISARLINVETAEIVNTHNVSGEMNNMSSLLKMAGEIADNLSKGSFAEQAADAERQKYENLRKQGYVDLGLPSGTWWKKENENECYEYPTANRKFGNKIPTKEQYQELINACSWSWDNDGYKLTSKYNGNSITFPKSGCTIGDNDYLQGFYWTRTTFYDSGIKSYAAWVFRWHHVGENLKYSPMYKINENPLEITSELYGSSPYGNATNKWSIRLVEMPNM